MAKKSLQSAYLAPSAAKSGGVNYSAPDLTRHPPRSPRTQLGGYVHFPRLIDKARATVAGTNGDFHYDCPMDQRFWSFTGVNPAAFLKQVKAGKSDSELLAYVTANLKPKRSPSEIKAWSLWYSQQAPDNPDSRAFFNDVHRKNGAHRKDIETWFDWLELDDYVTYGGRP